MSLRDWVVLAMLGACVTNACGGRSSERRSDGGDDETGGRGGNSGATGGASTTGGGSTTGGTSTTGGASGTGGTAPSTPISLQDPNNYQFTSTLTIEVVDTEPGVDLDICWTDVVTDLACGDLDPESDIDAIALMRFQNLSTEEIQEFLSRGELDQTFINGYAQWDTDHASTCTKFSALSVFGSEFDISTEYAESMSLRYLFQANGSVSPGAATRSMIFARPVSTSTNRRVDIPDGCGMQELTADLGTLEPVGVPANPPWFVTWRDLTRDGQGNPIQFGDLDLLRLSFYADRTLSELEEGISELDRIATESFELDISGSQSASLEQARNPIDGQDFSGFEREAEGIWLLTLTCSACSSPAPAVVTVLQP